MSDPAEIYWGAGVGCNAPLVGPHSVPNDDYDTYDKAREGLTKLQQWRKGLLNLNEMTRDDIRGLLDEYEAECDSLVNQLVD